MADCSGAADPCGPGPRMGRARSGRAEAPSLGPAAGPGRAPDGCSRASPRPPDPGGGVWRSPIRMMEAPRLVFALHAHLPDVRWPDVQDPWPVDWFFEALRDAYIPLTEVFEGWARDGLPVSVVLSVSPTLLSMLQDSDLVEAFVRRQTNLQRLAEALGDRILMEGWDSCLKRFEAWDRDLSTRWLALNDAGVLDLHTTAATHGLLPLLNAIDPRLAMGQVRSGLREFEARMGRPASGFWLPECAFGPELEPILTDCRVPAFFVDVHGATGARFGTGSPIQCPTGPVAFPRDPGCALRVWSPDFGFPSRPMYRDFHLDSSDRISNALRARFNLPADRRPLGFKRHRVTDRHRDDKLPYDPQAASRQVDRDAGLFLEAARQDAQQFEVSWGRPWVGSAPFDAELFGHWWFEGVQWLDLTVRRGARAGFKFASTSDILRSGLPVEVRSPRTSSWGRGGHHQTWLSSPNAWVQDEVERVGRSLLAWTDQARLEAARPDPMGDALAEAAMLVQASDWPFLMVGDAFPDHAKERVRRAIDRFEGTLAGRYPPQLSTFRSITWTDFCDISSRVG